MPLFSPSSSVAAVPRGGTARPGFSASDLSVLQPDVTFSAPPRALLAQSVIFSAASCISAVSFFWILPFPTEGRTPAAAWFRVFIPVIAYGLCGALFHGFYIAIRKNIVLMQLGPEPDPAETVPTARRQWEILQRAFDRQHVASNASDMLLHLGVSCAAALLLADVLDGAGVRFTQAALPLVVAGLLGVVLQTVYQLRCVHCIAVHAYVVGPHRDIPLAVCRYRCAPGRGRPSHS